MRSRKQSWEDLPHVQVGQLELKITFLGQHTQVKACAEERSKGDRKIHIFKELVHIEFFGKQVVTVVYLVVQGQLIDKSRTAPTCIPFDLCSW